MPKKARPTPDGSRANLLASATPESGQWLFDRAQGENCSLTDLVVGFVEDARTWWEHGQEVADALSEDAEKLGLSQRDYVFYLLAERYQAVRERGAGWEKDRPAVLLAQRR